MVTVQATKRVVRMSRKITSQFDPELEPLARLPATEDKAVAVSPKLYLNPHHNRNGQAQG